MRQLDDSIPELQADIDFRKIQMLSTDVVLNDAKALYEEWAEMDFQKKRAIVETITDRITVGKDEIDIALAYDPSLLNGLTRAHNLMDSY